MQNILFFGKKYMKDIIVFALIFVCLTISAYNIYNEQNLEIIDDEDIAVIEQVTDENSSEENKITTVNIDIKGAVKNPGVYKVENDSIINDAINKAGGFNSNAYKNGINLSKKVTDEMVIYVYTKSEIKSKENNTKEVVATTNTTCETPDYNICECIEEKESIIETNSTITNTQNENKDVNQENNTQNEVKLVNINVATASELTTLSGIGESKATAIIKHREENGKFTNITDIMNVSGIGEALFAKIKDFITV